MGSREDLIFAIAYFTREDMPRDKFVKEFKQKGYKLFEFLEVYNIELSKKVPINFAKEGDTLLNCTFIFCKSTDEFYDQLEDYKQLHKKKWLQVENDEQTDRKKYTKKKTEKGDFAFNFKSVVDSIDNSCKLPNKPELYKLESMSMDYWKYKRFDGPREDTVTFFGSYARGELNDEPAMKSSMRIFDKFCEDMRPCRSICVLPCNHALVYRDPEEITHIGNENNDQNYNLDDIEQVRDPNEPATIQPSGSPIQPDSDPTRPDSGLIELPNTDTTEPINDLSNDVGDFPMDDDFPSSIVNNNSFLDDDFIAGDNPELVKEMHDFIAELKTPPKSNIKKYPVKIAKKLDQPLLVGDVDKTFPRLNPLVHDRTASKGEKMFLVLNDDPTFHTAARQFYVALFKARRRDIKQAKGRKFNSLSAYKIGISDHGDQIMMYESVCFGRASPKIPTEPIVSPPDSDVGDFLENDDVGFDGINEGLYNGDDTEQNEDLIVDDFALLEEVYSWKQYLRPFLEYLKSKPSVNITTVKQETLRRLPSDNTLISYQSFVRDMSQSEAAHTFMSLLILANEKQVRIEIPNTEYGFCLDGQKVGRL